METSNLQVIGWGADLRPEDRPGVPMEMDPPRHVGTPPARHVEQLVHSKSESKKAKAIAPSVRDPRRPVPPVYGTIVPLRGVSGLLRRAAYLAPAHKPRRWLMLMVADRVDVLEHVIVPRLLWVGGLTALGVLAARGLRRLTVEYR